MYFEKQIMVKENHNWIDKTNYEPIVNNALKGNNAILIKGNNWQIQNKNKITLNGGLI